MLTAAEEARTLVQSVSHGTLATIDEAGGPWASLVAHGPLGNGDAAFCVSTYAEHGRNLERDQRASLCVAAPIGDDPLATGRVTVSGVCERPDDEAAVRAALPSAELYADWDDFSWWVLRVARVRWVGGYGRMDTVDVADYVAAEPDPVAPHAAGAVTHLNDDHADALLSMARALAGMPEASAALCRRADRYGLDLRVTSPAGRSDDVRIPFATPCTEPGGLRAATVELARRSRSV